MTRKVQSVLTRGHAHKPLRIRGGVVHTFATLLAPLAISLVFLGFYLLGSAVAHPLTADSVSLIVASIILALGFLLLSYLLRTAMASLHLARTERSRGHNLLAEPSAILPSGVEQDPHASATLAFHRSYVDSARIRR
jgi:hypothetical protein